MDRYSGANACISKYNEDLQVFDRDTGNPIDTEFFDGRTEVVVFKNDESYVAIDFDLGQGRVLFYHLSDESKIRHKKFSYENCVRPVYCDCFVADRTELVEEDSFKSVKISASSARYTIIILEAIARECREKGMEQTILTLEIEAKKDRGRS
ncbi:MAG: hypothetical protein PHY80_00665 [Rickettsiales bacterium]|nr:hypothetical protein [Rickettsiales bacterium]